MSKPTVETKLTNSIRNQQYSEFVTTGNLIPVSSGGGSTESQYLSKSTNNQINIYFSESRSNTMTTIL